MTKNNDLKACFEETRCALIESIREEVLCRGGRAFVDVPQKEEVSTNAYDIIYAAGDKVVCSSVRRSDGYRCGNDDISALSVDELYETAFQLGLLI